jgi:DNA phosphorothioation-dependent restriction protein DptG
MLSKRVQLLFDPEEFSYLQDLADKKKTTVSAMVRDAVEQVYETSNNAERTKTEKFFKDLHKHWSRGPIAKEINYRELIEEGRER